MAKTKVTETESNPAKYLLYSYILGFGSGVAATIAGLSLIGGR